MTLTMNFSQLTNAELLSFGQDLDSILSPLSETIAPVFNPFQNALSRYAEIAVSVIEKQVAQQQTGELAGADDNRDGLFRGVKYITQAYLLHPDKTRWWYYATKKNGAIVCSEYQPDLFSEPIVLTIWNMKNYTTN